MRHTAIYSPAEGTSLVQHAAPLSALTQKLSLIPVQATGAQPTRPGLEGWRMAYTREVSNTGQMAKQTLCPKESNVLNSGPRGTNQHITASYGHTTQTKTTNIPNKETKMAHATQLTATLARTVPNPTKLKRNIISSKENIVWPRLINYFFSNSYN